MVCRILDIRFCGVGGSGVKFFFKKRKKIGFGRGLPEVSWDVRFWAKNKGELVTSFGKMLVFGLKMGLP